MIILGIETSCDETAVCIIEADGPVEGANIRIRANITLSQAALHAQYGGVFPNLAKREHIKNLLIILKEVLKESEMSEAEPDIDAIAVTYGPGLEPCLWTGITFAEELGKKWGVLVYPVNHMEGHIFSALLHRKNVAATNYHLLTPNFPALALLISGGHTELDLMENYGKYRLIGETRDDAVGEAFDKVARLLGLPYPGGPEISRLAETARQGTDIRCLKPSTSDVNLPRPMLHSGDYDFSFSGIKTAVLYLLKKIGPHTSGVVAEIALEFENAVTEVLVSKTKRALREYGAQTLIVAGGVIANTHIRREFTKLAAEESVPLLIPEIQHTTDNALMIAVAAYATAMSGAEGRPLHATANIRADGTAKIC
ncbi:MAG: tRNA (adenosine(37)-N6)-threonylcarbamoyltransferase complex transferase subunit TsaD [bacterium]|nr:tRNA (adenosine(37)-N6)-threonylcarbamoyltransferase complex transferase subunit TsaD [bacterium]